MNALIDTILSPNSSMIMLFAFAGLLVFGLTMFFYKWLLAQGGGSISSSPPTLVAPDLFGQFLFHHAALYNVSNSRTTTGRRRPSINNNKGLQPSVISSIPQFVFGRDDHHQHHRRDGLILECVICLSAFEDGDEGRRLGCCGNEFHLDCIDLWLRSHTTCPICRARPDVICTNNHVEILSENNETSNNSNVNYEECFDMRVRVEDPTSMLEIVVEEVPNVETKVNPST